MAQDIIANTLSVDNIEAKTLKIDNQPFHAKASTSTLGGVKIGSGINVDSEGKISVASGNTPRVFQAFQEEE